MELDIGYIAGVIDARGHIETHPTRTRVAVTTKRKQLLQWLATHTGVGITLDDREYHKRGCTEHCELPHQHSQRRSAYWRVDGIRAGIVLASCYPYLVEQRLEAHAALQSLADRWPAAPSRHELCREMKRLGWPLIKRADLP